MKNEKSTPKSYDLCLIISDLGAGGAQRVISTLLQAWAASKSIVVMTLASWDTDFYVLPEGIDRIVINGINESKNLFIGMWSNIKRIVQIRKALKRTDATTILSFIAPTNILTILAAWGLKCKVIISERNDPSRQSFKGIWDLLRRRLYCYADCVTANTRGALKAMESFVPVKKLHYLPNPIALRASEEVIGFAHPTILAVGRLHQQKAYDILLQAFSRFIHDFPEWRLAILGDGPLKNDLHRLSEQIGIHHYVQWYKNVKNVDAFYRAATLFVLPSRYEGMPNALLEAMSCGLPCIVSDGSPGPLELIEHKKSGYVVPVENIEALHQAMDCLAMDVDLRERLSKNAVLSVQTNKLENVLTYWDALLSATQKSIYEEA